MTEFRPHQSTILLRSCSEHINDQRRDWPSACLSVERSFNQLEHLLEAGMLTSTYLSREVRWFAPLLLLALRPAAVAVGLWRSDAPDELV